MRYEPQYWETRRSSLAYAMQGIRQIFLFEIRVGAHLIEMRQRCCTSLTRTIRFDGLI